MKAMDKLIARIDKKLERFDPIWQAEHGVGGQRSRYYDKTGVATDDAFPSIDKPLLTTTPPRNAPE